MELLQGEGTLLATGSYDGQARIWSRDGKTLIFPLKKLLYSLSLYVVI